MYYKKMESNDNFKKINIKNHTFYYFDDIIKIEDFDLYNILIDEKSYENVLVYNKFFVRIIISLYVLDSIKEMNLL